MVVHDRKRFKMEYCVVSNIPCSFHSADLRNYFSQFIEGGNFDCFHFRHRPEQRRRKTVVNEVQTSLDCKPTEQALTADETDHNNESSERSRPTSTTRPTTSSSSNRPRLVMKSGTSTGNVPYVNVGNTMCCILKIKENMLIKFIKMYNNKHWIGRNGSVLGMRCIISRITVKAETVEKEKIQTFPYKTRGECKIPSDREEFSQSDLDSLVELRPPDIMPNGNVGTPTSVFLNLIKSCRFPPKMIKKLGLTFPKSRTNKRYGNVPFDYGGEVVNGDEETETILTGTGNEIEDELDADIQENLTGKLDENVEEQKDTQENQEGSGSDDDDDTCEEWERHEALHDDVHSQDRNKERLYEEEMEVVWEKGGSGLVFYTDAAYWDAQKGDFDERTSDDWDVDTSIYYEKNGGDKDARDYVQMRLEQRLRSGEQKISAFSKKIGAFEKHTKGIGRKVLQKHGWKDGDGLGRTIIGMADALDNEGQHPKQKTGLGYHGESLRSGGPAKKRQKEGYRLTTIYDDPQETDPPEMLLRSNFPEWMKYRQEVKFMKASDNSINNSSS
ncbi:G patch domain-containing protein 3-like [Anneissia japonica]|uniref:G patch domain-containing protein 3-like n=1 Tax=Anneissia japonica TaxID=1529436 RepID=UPI0014255AC9|nr:G patch domain-containing protein 3-like [Anneissia japonica]